MIKVWDDYAWEDYLYWQSKDKKTLKRINLLIQDIDRNGYDGIGKPEALTGSLKGYWSRRIDEKNRIVYRINENKIEILQCRTHYGDKQISIYYASVYHGAFYYGQRLCVISKQFGYGMYRLETV